MDSFMTVKELSKLIKIKKSTLYTWAYRKQIPSQKIGKALRFSQKDIECWLETQKRKAVYDF